MLLDADAVNMQPKMNKYVGERLKRPDHKVMCKCLLLPYCAAQQHCMTYSESNMCVFVCDYVHSR